MRVCVNTWVAAVPEAATASTLVGMFIPLGQSIGKLRAAVCGLPNAAYAYMLYCLRGLGPISEADEGASVNI